MKKIAEFALREMKPSSAIEHEIAVRIGPKLHGELPNIVVLELLVLDPRRDGVGDDVERGRLACLEVAGKLASPRPRMGEDVVEDARMGESVIHITVHQMDHFLFEWPRLSRAAEILGQLFELAIDDLVEQRFAAGEVVIDGHGSNADFTGAKAPGPTSG